MKVKQAQAQFMGEFMKSFAAGMAWTKLNTRTDNEYVQKNGCNSSRHNVKVLFDKLIDERPKHILWCTLIFLISRLYIPSDCNWFNSDAVWTGNGLFIDYEENRDIGYFFFIALLSSVRNNI